MLRLVFSLLVCSTCSVFGYNLEDRLPLYKRGPEKSTFGFSLTMHKTSAGQQTSLANSLLVIGSPTAAALPSQPNTENPGGIFSCPVTTNKNDCSRVEMDTGGSTKGANKSGQWLGVSVKSQGEGKYIVTCAHRYSQTFGRGRSEIERVCGKCFLLNGSDSNQLRWISPEEAGRSFIASPCDLVDSSRSDLINFKTTYGYAQHGVSIALSDNEYLSGAPGAWSWAGAMFDFQILNITTSVFGMFTQKKASAFPTLGCVSGTEYTTGIGRVSKCKNIPLRRDSYMGFSVARSNALFRGSSETIYIAGSPKGNYTGAIVFYRKDPNGELALVPMLNDIISGDFIGSSFGFSVAASDLNNDGLDDLIVGAPQYYQYGNDGKYGGAVYVYINNETNFFRHSVPQKLYGPLDSFFGYAVAPVGDIDQDGFNDFAVSAPHDKPSGKVRIFRGSASGKVKKSQTLNGEDFSDVTPDIKGFGISLSGEVDIDNNKYPDLLVGTLSDHAILLRARPIISVVSLLQVDRNIIDVKRPDCSYKGKSYSCFDLRFCFNYTARHNEYKKNVPIIYSLTLDTEFQNGHQRQPRAHFTSVDGPSIINGVVNLTEAGLQICPGSFKRIYFRENAKDRLSPVKVDFSFKLASDEIPITPENPGDPVFNVISDPILDPDHPNRRTVTVALANNCGNDGCQSNLKVNGTLPDEVLVGSNRTITLKIDVWNDGEEAHEAFVKAKLPPRVYYDSYTTLTDSGAKIECFTSETGGTTFVTCSLGNPYETDSKDTIAIQLDASQLDLNTELITVEVALSTTSQNPGLVPVVISSKVIVEAFLSVTSYGKPQQVRYTNALILGESAIRFTNQIGPLLEYTFNVKNDGIRMANGIKLNVKLPTEIQNGKWLLYPVSTSVLGGGKQVTGECNDTLINPLSYRLPDVASRTKREASTELYKPRKSASTAGARRSSAIRLDCNLKNAMCVTVGCSLEPLAPRSTTSVSIKARLWNSTFLEEFKNIDLVKVRTTAELSSTLPNIRITSEEASSTIETTVDHSFLKGVSITVFPWWYILIAVIIMLLIYTIIIFLLIRCGFFKRKRIPREEDETEDKVRLMDDDEKPIEVSESVA